MPRLEAQSWRELKNDLGALEAEPAPLAAAPITPADRARAVARPGHIAPEVVRAAPVAALARVRSPRRGRFTRSPQKMTGRARRAFRENGPGHRLMDALGPAAYLLTLTPADLDPRLADDPSGLYDATVMTAIFAAVARAFRGPVCAVAEVGKGRPGRRGRG